MFHNFTSDQQFTSWKFSSLLFPMMITIHQRNQNVSNDNDNVSKSDQNSLPWVLPDKYITDWLTIQLILSLIALFSLFLPSTNIPLFEKCNVLLSLMINNSSMNRISMLEISFLMSKFLCYIYPSSLPNLARLCTEKFLVLPTKSWNDTKHVQFPWWQDQSYSSANYIHCSQNCLSIFTIHHNSQFTFKTVRFSSEAEHQIFFFLRVVTWVRSNWVPM